MAYANVWQHVLARPIRRNAVHYAGLRVRCGDLGTGNHCTARIGDCADECGLLSKGGKGCEESKREKDANVAKDTAFHAAKVALVRRGRALHSSLQWLISSSRKTIPQLLIPLSITYSIRKVVGYLVALMHDRCQEQYVLNQNSQSF